MLRIETEIGSIEVDSVTEDFIPLNEYVYLLLAQLLVEQLLHSSSHVR